MSFADVANSFRLSEDYAKYRTQNWELQELYQRALDRERVHEMAANYLQSGSGRPAFFNSLTVALSAGPELAQLSANVVQFPGATSYSLPGLALAVQRTEMVEGIKVPASGAFGRAAWATSDDMMAVAIDGQHRLAAIQKFAQTNRQQANNSYVSVIVVLFDKQVGFRSTALSSPVEAMRSVFIDLNKHAVPVSAARNLLLDDASAHAACVRSLMSKQLALSPEKNGAGNNKIETKQRELGEFDRTIPLALVDWHGENKSKIDEGPYITSVLALNWWTGRLLKANGTKKYLWKLPGRFDPDAEHPYRAFTELAKQVGMTGATLKRIDDCKAAIPLRSFHFTDDEIKDIGNAFGKRWGGAVVTLLCTLAPYRAVVKKRNDAKSVEPKFTQWYQCFDDYKPFVKATGDVAAEFKQRLESTAAELKRQGVSADEFRKLVQEIEALKKKNIFFLLVAQRALLIAFTNMLGEIDQIKAMSKLLGDVGAEVADDPMCVIARYLVTAINAIDAKNPDVFTREIEVSARAPGQLPTFSKRFWSGSVLNPQVDAQVDFSEAAAKRTALWLQLMAHLYWVQRCKGGKGAERLVADYLDGTPATGSMVADLSNFALAALIPKLKSTNSPRFYDSPANFLAQMPEKLNDTWRKQREALAAERLKVITDAVRVAVT
jgi:DGQHR domain-containing protein